MLKCRQESNKNMKLCLEGQPDLILLTQSIMQAKRKCFRISSLSMEYGVFFYAGKPNLAGSWSYPPCQIQGETRNLKRHFYQYNNISRINKKHFWSIPRVI